MFSTRQVIASFTFNKNVNREGNIKNKNQYTELTFSIYLIDLLKVLQVSQPAGNKTSKTSDIAEMQ